MASWIPAWVAQPPEPPSLSPPVDPPTAGLAPFGLLMLLPQARRRLSHPTLLVVVVILAGMALSVSACGPIPTAEPEVETTTTIGYSGTTPRPRLAPPRGERSRDGRPRSGRLIPTPARRLARIRYTGRGKIRWAKPDPPSAGRDLE